MALTKVIGQGIDNITVDSSGIDVTCAAGATNVALQAYHPTSTSARNIAKFQSNVGGTQQDKVVIQCDGNVGIGTTSPAEMLSLGDTSDTNVRIQFTSSTSGGNTIQFGDGTGASAYRGYINYTHSDDALAFATSAAEKMRIDSSGNVLVGTTSFAAGQDSKMIQPSQIFSSRNTTGAAGHMSFQNPNGGVGSITTSGSSTAFNTSSDYRLKENVTADWDATTRLKQLNPVRFNFIAEPDTTVDGFLAHEVQDIVPEAITGTKDGMRDEEYEVTPAVLDEDGNEVTPAVMGTRSVPDYQGIDQSKLVPLLVKTIQELEARIATLENA